MANAADYKDINGWSNEVYHVDCEYDFAKDGGAVSTIPLGIFKKKTLVRRAIVFVETACTSDGSATVVVGTTTADADGFLDATSGAVANLVDNAVLLESTGTNLVVAKGEYLNLIIGTAALTAGKVHVYLECQNVA